MLFNSLHFIVFFLFVTTTYYTLPGRWRWFSLLTASAYFYASFIPAYLLLLGIIIVFDYLAGIGIERSSGNSRRIMLTLSILFNVGFLCFFKYFDFLNNNISWLMSIVGVDYGADTVSGLYFGLALPIGLSFHTFQSMSYTIEVYRGNQRAERHFGIYALYVLFYPQLVAGPIERPQNVLWQFRQQTDFDWDNLRMGLWWMMWGMFKKVVIADRLALVTDPIFANPETQNAGSLAIAAAFYSIQIYCDFSGYSDIALGAARTMGFRLMVNFRSPYFARSIAEFWQRWHISLSTWFRDYVYIPMGGNRHGRLRTFMNLLVVFLLSGLWHGADWKFVIWGAIHGCLLIFSRLVYSDRHDFGRWPAWLQAVLTFLVVTLAWVFFRARNVSDAFLILGRLAKPSLWSLPNLPISSGETCFCLLLIMFLFLKEYLLPDYVPARRSFWPSLGVATLLCYLWGVFGSNQFIYFQF
ncbi:MBOAT family O-acyltransferase [Dyadobacter jiangsuensis]|uniref:D-alanyl-lipoteichoic acid acyltransferase DltB (MBOAT superfamily) n=1 Tax=Dyadobacter jiangsuensis TaxID=1591085 RepID=A0A2P8G845_9BACT|nr:MBOAT family O-acyltransferase [Dyadobacter jiangsuensis]PSL30128.1 D-alanyl-lipoteichoic acid acyltransferase DltB (MBOAT superfamily) [Dyadobacter jiangsuensis]